MIFKRKPLNASTKSSLLATGRSLALFAAATLATGNCLAGATSPGVGDILEVNVTGKADRVNGQPVVLPNPMNPANLVFVSTNHFPVNTSELGGLQCFVAHSEDGGKTWSEAPWPYGDRQSCGDPYLAVDSTGTFYVAFNRLCGKEVECPPGPGQVGVSKSSDGGRTWSTPVDTPAARSVTPRLRIDAATDNIYVVGGLGRGNDPIAVTVSSDHGITWTPSNPLPSHPFGNQIAVHDGMLATATALKVVDMRAEATDVLFWVSTDNGKTFTSYPVTNSKGTPIAPPTGTLVPTSQTTNSDTLAMTDPIPLVSADPTHKGRFALLVPRGDNLDVYITDDAGKRWNDPTVVHAPSAAKPWIEFSAGGNLGIMWRTFADGEMDAYSAVSFDGGKTFSASVKVNRETEPYKQIQAGGDEWSRIFLDDNYAYVSWSDSRNGREIDGIMARVPLARYKSE